MSKIFQDYPDIKDFVKMMMPALHSRTVSLADKDSVPASFWLQTIYRSCGNKNYYGTRQEFYYKAQGKAATLYHRIKRRENIVSQITQNFKDFLTTETSWREGDNQNITRTINESQEPLISLKDLSQGAYEPFQNRADYVKGKKTSQEIIQTNKGIIKGKNEEGKLIIGENWKRQEQMAAAGKILSAMASWEVNLEEFVREFQRGLFHIYSFPVGITYADPVTGRIRFKAQETIELEEETEKKFHETEETFWDPNLPYPENLRRRITSLKKELKVTSNKEIVLKRIGVAEDFIEAWEKPLELKAPEDFDKIKEEVIGFEEFIEEVRNYLQVVRKRRKSGKQILPSQRFYLLLGDPGVGKTHISGMIAKYLGKQFIQINCADAELSELVGVAPPWMGADIGNIARAMKEAKDRAPVILFDEVDKCKDTEVLNTISILFDDSVNKNGFDDKFLRFIIPMNEVFFVATANDVKNLPGFVKSRCTRVKINILTWQQRMEIARRSFVANLKHYELEQYLPRVNDEILKKCLVKERGIRQTRINTKKITDQIDALDTKYGGDQEINMGKISIPININFSTYSWIGIIESNGLDPNCPASQGGEHQEDHECFVPENVPGWVENMSN